MSVSRRASPLHLGQRVSTNSAMFLIGDPTPSKATSVGSTTGRSSSGTGTGPQSSQWMMGMGAPQ